MLFDSLKIGNICLQNRLCAAPIATASGTFNGSPTEKSIKIYKQIANSDVSLVVVEHYAVDSTGRTRQQQFLANTDITAKAHAQIARVIKDVGKLALAQINHSGAKIMDGAVFKMDDYRCLSPSGIGVGKFWEQISATPEKLSVTEIKKIIDNFASAAKRIAYIAGYDGIVIHAAHGYLVGQFMSPLTNMRIDAYGGSYYRRMRFLYDIVDAVRKSVPDKVIAVRLGAADTMPNAPSHGLTITETATAARELVALGVDIIFVSGNLCGYGLTEKREGYFAPYALAIRNAINAKIPIECTGGIRSIRCAERMLQEKSCDLIGIGRPLHANYKFLETWIKQEMCHE